jgi:sugar-specific transcriptional regulator TrmB
MNLHKTLAGIGFTEKEATIYIAALKSGPVPATALAKASGIKRTTVYFVLEQLISRGVIGTEQTKSTTFYSAISPHRLIALYTEKNKILQESLPDFEKIFKSQLHKPHTQIFEGVDGVRQVYKEAEQFAHKPNEVLYFGSSEHLAKEEYGDILESWVNIMKSKNHRARDILDSYGEVQKHYAEAIAKNANPNHHIRLAPKTIHFPENDNLIYGNKMAIFSHYKEVFVVVIESESIVNAYRSLYEMAWKSAEEIK